MLRARPHWSAASHTDRYEFRCSAGHRIFYHQPCWRKATGEVSAASWLRLGACCSPLQSLV